MDHDKVVKFAVTIVVVFKIPHPGTNRIRFRTHTQGAFILPTIVPALSLKGPFLQRSRGR